MGEEINLPPYAVIYTGKRDGLLNDTKRKKVDDFNDEHETDFILFYIKDCKPVEEVLNQLKSEDYKIIYKNHMD